MGDKKPIRAPKTPPRRIGPGVELRILHCYDEVTTASGLVLQVGIGLSSDLLMEAMDFLLNSQCETEGSDEPDSLSLKDHLKDSTEGGMEKSFFHLLATFA